MKLGTLIDKYIGHRQSLGEQMRRNCTLRAFGRFIGANTNVTDVNLKQVERFLEGTGPITQTWHIKLGGLRSFYQYAVSRGHVIKPPLPVVVPKRPPSFVPYIYSREELRRLLQAAKHFKRPRVFKPRILHLMLLVLYATGMRVQELLNLNLADVDLSARVMTVKKSKFGKTRLVPFSQRLQKNLVRHAKQRGISSGDAPFFATDNGVRIKADTLQHNYRILCEHADIRRNDGACYQPRLHDLRHTFAVHRLISWYRQGADVQKLLPSLSVYLGHVNIRATQVYLSMTPELLEQANRCFEQYATKEPSHD
jgi:integrase/recombinase XerD